MQAHASRSKRCMLGQAGFSSFLVPVRAVCSKFSTSSPHLTQMSPTWKAKCARSSCHTPPRAAFNAAL
eukprot:3313337-Amphidinium_carterae.1